MQHGIPQNSSMNIERGPDWLLVRVRRLGEDASDTSSLANRLWSLLRQHFTSRLVLELDEIDELDQPVLQQLVQLHERICDNGGVMRLSRLSPHNERLLRAHRLEHRFPPYRTRIDAVFARYRPRTVVQENHRSRVSRREVLHAQRT